MTSDSEEVTNSETESPTEKNPLKKVKKTINKAKGKITLNISGIKSGTQIASIRW